MSIKIYERLRNYGRLPRLNDENKKRIPGNPLSLRQKANLHIFPDDTPPEKSVLGYLRSLDNAKKEKLKSSNTDETDTVNRLPDVINGINLPKQWRGIDNGKFDGDLYRKAVQLAHMAKEQPQELQRYVIACFGPDAGKNVKNFLIGESLTQLCEFL